MFTIFFFGLKTAQARVVKHTFYTQQTTKYGGISKASRKEHVRNSENTKNNNITIFFRKQAMSVVKPIYM